MAMNLRLNKQKTIQFSFKGWNYKNTLTLKVIDRFISFIHLHSRISSPPHIINLYLRFSSREGYGKQT